MEGLGASPCQTANATMDGVRRSPPRSSGQNSLLISQRSATSTAMSPSPRNGPQSTGDSHACHYASPIVNQLCPVPERLSMTPDPDAGARRWRTSTTQSPRQRGPLAPADRTELLVPARARYDTSCSSSSKPPLWQASSVAPDGSAAKMSIKASTLIASGRSRPSPVCP